MSVKPEVALSVGEGGAVAGGVTGVVAAGLAGEVAFAVGDGDTGGGGLEVAPGVTVNAGEGVAADNGVSPLLGTDAYKTVTKRTVVRTRYVVPYLTCKTGFPIPTTPNLPTMYLSLSFLFPSELNNPWDYLVGKRNRD